MKLLFILMALPVLAATCKKDKDENTDKLLKGKLIRTSICSGWIVQVLNDDSIGEDGWKDIKNNNVQYDNVFTVNNTCKLSFLIGNGTTLYFKIDKTTDSDCVHCMVYDGAPMTIYNISDFSIEK